MHTVRLLLCLLLLAPTIAVAQGAGQSSAPSAEALARRSLDLVNASRAENGLDPLSLSAPAMKAAAAHAANMARRSFYAHEAPDGSGPRDRFLKAEGSTSAIVRENIARCTGCAPPADEAAVEELHEGWMNSPGHRANILAEGLATYGFAVAHADASDGERPKRYAVELFAGPGGSDGADALAEEGASDALATLIGEWREREGPRVDPALAAAAARLSPDGSAASLERAVADLARYGRFQLLTASCTGCGAAPTREDLVGFLEQWRGSEAARAILSDPSLSALGAKLRADGEGRKSITVLFGAPRG